MRTTPLYAQPPLFALLALEVPDAGGPLPFCTHTAAAVRPALTIALPTDA